MTYQAIFLVDNRQYVIHRIDYDYVQSTDSHGQPIDRPKVGLVHIEFESVDASDSTIMEWMVSKSMKKNASVVFMGDNGQKMKEMQIVDAYCVYLHESFVHDHVDTMKTTIRLSCGKIIPDGNSNHVIAQGWAKESTPAEKGNTMVADFSSVGGMAAGITSNIPTTPQGAVSSAMSAAQKVKEVAKNPQGIIAEAKAKAEEAKQAAKTMGEQAAAQAGVPPDALASADDVVVDLTTEGGKRTNATIKSYNPMA